MIACTEPTREEWLASRMTMIGASESPAIEFRTLAQYPGYRFGSDGSIWSSWSRGRRQPGDTWTRLNATRSSNGYMMIGLHGSDGKTHRCLMVHRIILEAFTGPCPEGCEARHYPSADRSNNAASNLIWGTRSQNHADKWEQGSMPHGEGHGMSKLTAADVIDIRQSVANGESQVSAAARYGVGKANINAIICGRTWKWL